MKMRKKIRRGFTLVELVVVIAVIAILSAVSVGAYFGITDSANSSNATHGSKQVTDLWYVYSLDRDYNPNASLKEKADDFCLDFMPYNGPDYDVNWKEVTVYTEAVDPSLSVSGLNRIPYQQNSVELPETTSGILFKIETTYPTWFIVIDDQIVEKSETIYKNDNEFLLSLSNSEYLVDAPEYDATNGYNYPFEIEVIGKDTEGDDVRGYAYYRVDIHNNVSDETEILSVKVGDSIKETDSVKYDTSSVIQTEGDNKTYQAITIKEKTTGVEIDTTEELKLDQKSTFDRISDRVVLENEKYAYYINKDVYELEYFVNNPSESLDDYPIILVEYSIDNAADPATDKVINTEVKYEAHDDFGYNIGWKKLTCRGSIKKTVTKTYIYKINEAETKYYLLTDINENTFEGKLNASKNYYIFANNYTIDKPLEIPSNTTFVVDYKVKTLEQAKQYISLYSSTKNYKIDYVSVSQKVENIVIQSDSILEMLKDLVLVKSEFLEKVLASKDITLNFGAETTGSPVPFDNNFDEKFNSFINNDERPIKDDNTGFEPTEANIKNVLTIKNNSELKLLDNSYIIVDSEIYTANSSKPIRNGDHAIVNIEEGSSLRLKNASMKALGKVQGKGNIYSDEQSKVLEILKVNDYIGGTYTASVTFKNVLTREFNKFPFIDYSFENISAKLHLSEESLWYGISTLTAGSEITQIPAVYFYSNNTTHNSINSLFKITDSLGNDYPLTKQFDNTLKVSNIEMDGVFEEDSLSVTITLLGQSVTINTEATAQPISNINVVINKDSILTLNNKNGYDIMPTTTIDVKGTLNVTSDSQVRFVTPGAFKEIMANKPTFDKSSEVQAAQHYNRGTYEKYASVEYSENERMIDVFEGGSITGNFYIYPTNLNTENESPTYEINEINYYGFDINLDLGNQVKYSYAYSYKPGSGSGLGALLDKLEVANFKNVNLYKLVFSEIVSN